MSTVKQRQGLSRGAGFICIDFKTQTAQNMEQHGLTSDLTVLEQEAELEIS